MLKLISWNVNGLRACCGKGFEETFNRLDADFFCLQETKMQEGQLDLQFMGYQSYWNYADKKGYSGTAIYTRHQPLSVTYGIGVDEHDHEGRVITLEMEQFYLITVYVPNSQDGLRRLDYRMKWEDDFQGYLKKLEEIKVHHKRSDKQRITTEIRMENIKDFFRMQPEKEADFRELIHDRSDMYDVAVTFSSVLEMMKERKLDAHQKYLFGDITVKATEHLYDDNTGGTQTAEGNKETSDGK